ncbi:C2 calcium-dependent domain-containing protein 4A [Erethizon dorsatum]
MWCLEPLRRGRDRILRSRARRSRARSPAACANVLTPDRIPEFCIPPRLAPRLALAALRSSRGEEAGTDEGASRTDWDPRSQAALSLPHLPRARTAYGFCALLESPHTRRKESLFLGDPAPRPRARTSGRRAGDAPLGPPRAAHAAPCPARAAPAPRPRRRRLLRAPDRLLSRALRARRSRGPARARSLSSGDDGDGDGDERDAGAQPPTPAAERLEAEGAAALDADSGPRGGRLRLRLLRPEGSAAGAPEPRASGRRLRLALRPRGAAREQRRLVLGPSRGAAADPDSSCDPASGDTGRPRGRGSLLLGPLLLLPRGPARPPGTLAH